MVNQGKRVKRSKSEIRNAVSRVIASAAQESSYMRNTALMMAVQHASTTGGTYADTAVVNMAIKFERFLAGRYSKQR